MSKKIIQLKDKNNNKLIPEDAIALNEYSESKLKGYSCDYTNKLRKWKLIGEVIGNTVINLPENFNEIYIENEYKTSITNIIIPKELLTSNFKYYISSSYYVDATDNSTTVFRCRNTSVNLNTRIYLGNNITDSSTTRVFYR